MSGLTSTGNEKLAKVYEKGSDGTVPSFGRSPDGRQTGPEQNETGGSENSRRKSALSTQG